MYELGKDPRETKLVVPIVVGTRPEAIKLVPIILALRESDYYEPIVISTGQHNRMVEYIFELADIKPDVDPLGGLAPRQPQRARGLGDAALRRLLRRALRHRPRRRRRPRTTSSAAATRPPSSSTATPARRWPPRSRPSTSTSR